MGFNVGDRVRVVDCLGRYEDEDYYFGGTTDEVEIGDEGIVRLIDGNRILVKLDSGVEWNLHYDEILQIRELSKEAIKKFKSEIGDYTMAKKKYSLDVSKCVNLEEDKSYLRVVIRKELRDLIKIFAVDEETSYEFGNRYKIKRLLTEQHEYNYHFMILFDKELLENGKKDYLMSLSAYDHYSNLLRGLDNFVKCCMKVLQEEEFKVTIKTEKVR